MSKASSLQIIKQAYASNIVLISLAVFIVVVSLGAHFIAPFGINDQDLLARLQPPLSSGRDGFYLLGTDTLGRDLLSRLLYGMQTSLLIAIVGTLIGAIVGTLAGFAAAHFGGILEDAILAIVDIQTSLPFILIAITALAIFGNNMIVFVTIVGLQGWEVYARLVRVNVREILNSDHINAMRVMGASTLRIYTQHVFPNVANFIVVQMTLTFPAIILLESGLSFVGLGVQPPAASLGLMVSDGQDVIISFPWLAILPGTVICIVCLVAALIGDRLGDWLNVQTRS